MSSKATTVPAFLKQLPAGRFRGLDQLPLPAVKKFLAAAVRRAGAQRTSRV